MASAMADESYRKRMRDEGTCSICLDFFTDPVSLECGHNFCRSCVTRSWEERPACPQCRERVPAPRRLRTNQQLASLSQIAKELSEELRRQASAGRAVCGQHQEPLQLFCHDDQAMICVVCNLSSGHREHRVVPLEEAAQDQICQLPESLRKERENILSYKTENEKKSQEMLEEVQAEWEKIEAAFSQQHQSLEEQKKLLQAQKEEVEKEMVRRRDEHQASLSAELSSLDSLQNLGDILERCKGKPFEDPEAFPVALKWRIRDVCDINPFLEGIMKRFQDFLASGLQLQKANVTLDPDTAYPELVLSADGKSVRDGDEQQDLPDNPERFDDFSIVLGREGFTAGRHFWDIAVGSEEIWAVGVARKSVRRKGDIDATPESGIWEFGLWEREYRVSNRPYPNPVSLSEELEKVRVTLNYEGGQVSFFNADSGAHLYTFSGASFGGETILPYFSVSGEAQLTLLP